jgi:hypothetical protein
MSYPISAISVPVLFSLSLSAFSRTVELSVKRRIIEIGITTTLAVYKRELAVLLKTALVLAYGTAWTH